MIEVVDLDSQRRRIEPRLALAMQRVLAHGRFILGPEVETLEQRLQAFSGARHCITCANGTDALILALLALGIGAGDAVLVPDFTFVATAEAVARAGATPVLVDVCADTFCLDARAIGEATALARAKGLYPRAVIAVDLFGQPADYDAIGEVAAAHGLIVLADAAQSFGASYKGRKVGTLARITATSFYPSKPLGCYGDGGAVFTDDDDIAALMRSLRCHGQATAGRDFSSIGLNSRLDTLQAAVLLEKLEIFPDEVGERDAIARRYTAHLGGAVQCPAIPPSNRSVWAQYTISVADRDAFIAACAADGIATAVHYGHPLHSLSAYRDLPRGMCINSQRLARHVVSLPMHAYLTPALQQRIIDVASEAARTGPRRKQDVSAPQTATLG